MKNLKVLIVHARRTGYGVIRSLHKHTRDIHVADIYKTPLFYSRKIKSATLIRDITKEHELDLLDCFIQLAEKIGYRNAKPVVFTGKDDYLIFFAKHSNLLKKYFLFSFETDLGILKSVLSKKNLYFTALCSDVKVPRTYTDSDSLYRITNELKPPFIVKPEFKNLPGIDVVNSAFRIRICSTQKELIDSIRMLREINVSYVVQEFLEGNDSELYTMGVYCFKGEIVAWSSSKKIRQFPPIIGECSFGVTVYENDLMNKSVSLLRLSGITGICQIEYKRYRNEYYLIEINPRIWSWHEIHSKVGVNLALIACKCINNTFPKSIVGPQKGKKGKVYWIFPLMDYYYNVLNKNVSIYQFLIDLKKSDVRAFFWMLDPIPFFVHFIRTLKYFNSIRNES